MIPEYTEREWAHLKSCGQGIGSGPCKNCGKLPTEQLFLVRKGICLSCRTKEAHAAKKTKVLGAAAIPALAREKRLRRRYELLCMGLILLCAFLIGVIIKIGG